MTLVFADCEINSDRRELHRTGRSTHLEPQVFDLLVHLVRHRNRVVSKEELIRAVWDGRAISDDTLTSRVECGASGHRGHRRGPATDPDGDTAWIPFRW